jgi:hypothetical protein
MGKRFKIGDEVVALNNPKNKYGQPRIKGDTYIVKAIMYCSGCGKQVINLGASLPDKLSDYLECTCGKLTNNERLYWTNSEYFAKLDELEEALEEALENEDYDTAIILRDLKK